MRPDSVLPPMTTPVPLDTIRVSIREDDGTTDSVGLARDALADPRLTAADRSAVRNLAEALDYVRHRYNYDDLDDATTGVTLVLHALRGPAAGAGAISVTATNPYLQLPGADARPGAILPDDAARHELIHIMQARVTGQPIGGSSEQRGMGVNASGKIQALGVAEGLADAFSLLQAQSWQTGAGFRRQHAGEAPQVVRDYDHPDSPNALLHVRSRWDAQGARDASVDPHLQGGVVVAFARGVQQQVGWQRAQNVMWSILNDDQFAYGTQGWTEFAEAADRQATRYDGVDSDVADAVRASLDATNLTAAIGS